MSRIRFFTASEHIVSEGAYIKVTRHMSNHSDKQQRFVQSYRVCVFYDENTFDILAEFPGNEEGNRAASEVMRWMWDEIKKETTCITMLDCPAAKKFVGHFERG